MSTRAAAQALFSTKDFALTPGQRWLAVLRPVGHMLV